jgi:predicted AlkP superfamily pyrophosphatase or phosphodiesterase
MRLKSQIDIAPTIARVLGMTIPQVDGRPIEETDTWNCHNVVLIIVDSLGYDLYRFLEPGLKNIPAMARSGLILMAQAVSVHTSPAIASILSGLLPEHHKIFDKDSAKRSSLLSIPDIASSQGICSAVVMEKNGAEVYSDKIEIIGAISDALPPADFDREAARLSIDALTKGPRLLVTYFIGIDKTVHMGLGLEEIKNVANSIDHYVGEIASAAIPETLLILCGDHPIHAGRLKRMDGDAYVALVLSKINCR